jgi:hypothetical protein
MRQFLLMVSLAAGICQCGAKPDANADWYDGLLAVSGWQTIDRVGMPGSNLLFFNNDEHADEFNQMADSDEEIADFRELIVTKAASLRGDATDIFGGENTGSSSLDEADLAATLVPDVLEYKLDTAAAFPNGRTLKDDAIDTILRMGLNRTDVSDEVSTDSAFENSFPYLGNDQ